MSRAFTSFLALLLILCALPTYGQTSQLRGSNASRLTGIRISFLAENGIHPGLKVGTSYILGEKERARKFLLKASKKKKGNQLKIIQYLADLHMGFYQHPNNHTGMVAGIGATRMRTHTTRMRTFGLSLEINYLRRFYNIPTLEIDENGQVREIPGAGSNSLMFAFAPSFGKLYGEGPQKREWHLFVKPSFQLLRYDFAFFPNAALEIGLNLALSK